MSNKIFKIHKSTSVDYDNIIERCDYVCKWASLSSAMLAFISAGARFLGNVVQIKKENEEINE